MTEQFEILASLEAEQSVLGAILIDNDSANLLTGLTPKDFFSDKNGLIFKTAMSMISDGLPVDVITLDAELGKRGLSEETGGLAYLIDLQQNTPSAANVGRYARLVSESAAERELRFAAEQIGKLATERDGRSIADRQAEAVALLDKISDTAAGNSESMSYEDALEATLHRWERILETGGMLGFSTGFSNLDEATGGLQRGNLTVIGARPGMGKSVLAENIARHCAKNGLSVRYAIDYGRLKKYRMTQTETDNFALYISKARNWKFVIDTEMIGIDAIAARCRLEKRKSGLDLLVVDHLHLMPRKGVNEVAELDDITARLKRLAMELQIHVLLVAQLNRATEKQSDKRPSLADLRGSGGIEQNANLVLMPYREGYYDSEAPQGTAELIIAKNRDGERGVLDLTWEGQYQRFGEYEYYN